MICTFFGHRNAPKEIKPILKQALIDLIENKNVDKFYVGNHGQFDYMVKEALKELKQIYQIKYYVVLAYMPQLEDIDYSDTIFLDELNKVPYKYRIVERNKWMIRNSDYVICYVRRIGNCREFKELAEKQNKIIISL